MYLVSKYTFKYLSLLLVRFYHSFPIQTDHLNISQTPLSKFSKNQKFFISEQICNYINPLVASVLSLGSGLQVHHILNQLFLTLFTENEHPKYWILLLKKGFMLSTEVKSSFRKMYITNSSPVPISTKNKSLRNEYTFKFPSK